MGILDVMLAPRATKAESGPFVANMLANPPAASLLDRREPHQVMYEAAQLYRRNAWVAAAERAIIGRILQVPYRIEDPDGETVTAETHAAAADLLNILGDLSEIGGPISVTQASTSTRRNLWSKTLRHTGLCGFTGWAKDEREVLVGTPRRVLYVNPWRWSPAVTTDGEMVGWFIDHPDNPLTPPGARAVPLTLEEVVIFRLDPDDDSVFGYGIAEAANDQIGLNRLATGQASSTLAVGGRLTGIVHPVAGPGAVEISDDKWESLIRDWRNLSNDPYSAKRLQIVRAPVEFEQMAASPTDLQLRELLTGSKEDILNAWSVPTSQIGIAGAAGLNSGEARADDAEVLWEGACKPRLDAFREGLQTVLNEWEPRLGFRPTVVFDLPTFDDQEPAAKVADLTKGLPLTNDERRAQLGYDPLTDAVLGAQVWLPTSLVPVGLDTIEAKPGVGEMSESESSGKAESTLRATVERRWLGDMTRTVTALLEEMRDSITDIIEKRWDLVSRKPGDESIWWNESRWQREWNAALGPVYTGIADQSSVGASAKVGKADPIADVTDAVVRNGAARITGINTTTRRLVADIIRRGISEGQGPGDVATTLRDSGAFAGSRADLIARTETMLAYNEASLGTYARHGVEFVDALDGDQDDECASRVANNPWPVADAYGQQDHPNGTLDWAPVVERGKAEPKSPEIHVYVPESAVTVAPAPVRVETPVYVEPTPVHVDPTPILVDAPVTVNVPEGKAPVVNVAAPAPQTITTPPAQVTVNTPGQIEITKMPPRLKRATRRKDGQIEAMLEEDADG